MGKIVCSFCGNPLNVRKEVVDGQPVELIENFRVSVYRCITDNVHRYLCKRCAKN